MKLRQKLAVVLASAMVVTAVPVVTMAASTNSVSKVVTVADESALGNAAPVLKIELKDGFTSGAQFYLSLENAKWDTEKVADKDVAKTTDVLDENGVKIGTVDPKGSSTEATVTLNRNVAQNEKLFISLANVKVTGEAKITIDGEGTEIDTKTIVFANKSDSKATVTAKDEKTFYTTPAGGQTVGTIVLTEAVTGTLKPYTVKENDKDVTKASVIVLEMEHSDFEFVEGKVTVTGVRGLSGVSATVDAKFDGKDTQTLLIELPSTAAAAQKGALEISGVKVKSTDKSPSTGDLSVTVKGAGSTKVESKVVKVATVAEYGTELTVAEKKTITAGKDGKVKITYKEVTADSAAKGDVEFTIDKGYFDKDDLKTVLGVEETGLIYKNMKDKKANELIGFVITTGGKDADIEKFIDGKELKITTELGTDGDITLSTSGRYVESQSVVVAEAKANFAVKAEAMTLKVGQSKQVGGKLVITENEKGAFAKKSVITLSLAKEDGITFTGKPTVTVAGTAKVSTDWAKDDKGNVTGVAITLDKASKDDPATITVEGLEVKVDRTVPQGTYELGLSVSDYKGTLKSANFFVVGTPNTEELAANGLPKGKATFAIGSAEYKVNDTANAMDAAAYIQDPGYTMVPVRYVATAFGVAAKDILSTPGTATIFAGSRTVQLTVGSDVAIVNGAPIKLATKVVEKNGRTYAPVGEIAKILGISSSWDATAKVATFENK